jgi:hypothetical protein
MDEILSTKSMFLIFLTKIPVNKIKNLNIKENKNSLKILEKTSTGKSLCKVCIKIKGNNFNSDANRIIHKWKGGNPTFSKSPNTKRGFHHKMLTIVKIKNTLCRKRYFITLQEGMNFTKNQDNTSIRRIEIKILVEPIIILIKNK